jgi:hypothetical protein
MQLLNLPVNLPVYLPADTAVVPFGDPLSDATVTSSTTAVVAAPGYNNPAVNDIVAFSVSGSGAAMPAGLTAGTLYYVIAPISAGTFAVSATKGGSAVATTTTGAGTITLHLLSMQQYGTKVPFKSGATVVAMNISAADVTLKGASDTGTDGQDPQGPGSYSVIATIASGTMKLVQLNYDWILGSGTTVLSLLQN